MNNPHVGYILKTEFIEPLGLEVSSTIKDIMMGARDLTADLDTQLCSFFNLTPGYFLRLQEAYTKSIKEFEEAYRSR